LTLTHKKTKTNVNTKRQTENKPYIIGIKQQMGYYYGYSKDL
jgi:hypothetical protein